MFWEEVYPMYELASNMDIIEKNSDMKFNYLLHASSKDAMKSWRDLPIPFPNRRWIPPVKKTIIPHSLRKMHHASKHTPETRKKFEEVQRRVRETQQKARDLEFAHRGY